MIRSTNLLPKGVKGITVCDREADFYDFMVVAKERSLSYVIRVGKERETVDGKKIKSLASKKECDGFLNVTLPRSPQNQLETRNAKLSIRYKKVRVKLPRRLSKDKSMPRYITVTIIYVKEISDGGNGKTVEWFLVTNEPVDTLEDAIKIVQYYVLRWKIERFHYVLKQGCKVEKLQERTLQATLALLYIYSAISAKLLGIMEASRATPDLNATLYFSEPDLNLLYYMRYGVERPTDHQYSIQEALNDLTNSSFQRRPSDGPPGIASIWESYQEFEAAKRTLKKFQRHEGELKREYPI
jgi:hypothetical protein